MSEALLRISNLQAGYGAVRVLWDVNLEVRSGEIVTLVGANGAGKTTLLRTISGIVRAAEGRIVFAGRRIDGKAVAEIVRLGISHVPEGRHVFWGLSVEDNLVLGAAMLPSAWARRGASLHLVYELFPRLRERSRQPAGTLSGGEQQMLAIGRALMAQPALLLVDEPSLGLAPVVVQQLFRTLREVNRQGLTVLLVEQDVRRSLRMSHRAYVLENGRITLTGPGPELLDDPHVRRAYLAT
ncbi:MAG: ABC transporter ATP-binding protein [Armatimonadota bacterium]|nr:ABC transporter ATP-binding protein [Armatimonadota bacterium]MDR5696522.1 ABC transporter ATP-binding protein [Armatimonadota bacterium]